MQISENQMKRKSYGFTGNMRKHSFAVCPQSTVFFFFFCHILVCCRSWDKLDKTTATSLPCENALFFFPSLLAYEVSHTTSVCECRDVRVTVFPHFFLFFLVLELQNRFCHLPLSKSISLLPSFHLNCLPHTCVSTANHRRIEFALRCWVSTVFFSSFILSTSGQLLVLFLLLI